MHILRWDLDRTYLDTQIHSMRGLIRAALETAEQKRTIPGARDLLRGLVTHDDDVEATVLSGSPEQLRSVLARKLELDGVRYTRLVLKDNLGNLKRGRFRALRGQVGYKLPELLHLRLQTPDGTRESLFGDDAEYDALIYVAYAEILAGRLDRTELISLLKAGGSYPDQIERCLQAFDRLDHTDPVDRIFIHVDRGVPLQTFDMLGPRLSVVFSWYQAALSYAVTDELLDADLYRVADRCEKARGFGVSGLASLAQDAVRRGLVPGDGLKDYMASADLPKQLVQATLQAVDHLDGAVRIPNHPPSPDFRGFMRAIRELPG